MKEKTIKAKMIIWIIKHLSNYMLIKTLDLIKYYLDYCDITYYNLYTIYHIPYTIIDKWFA